MVQMVHVSLGFGSHSAFFWTVILTVFGLLTIMSWFWELEWIWEPQTCCLWKPLTNVARSAEQHTRLASAWRTSSRTSSPSSWPWRSLSHDGTKRPEGPGTKNPPHRAWWSSGLIAAITIIIDRCDRREVQIQWWSRGTRSPPKTTTFSKM